MVKTFYWHDRVVSRGVFYFRKFFGLNPYNYFLVGNAGDIFARDLIGRYYGCESLNCPEGGGRLLLIGSISHKVLHGDVLCGIGARSEDIAKCKAGDNVSVFGLRGPLSYDAFQRAGYDLSGVKFLMDPGLLIRFFVDAEVLPDIGKVGFIPHYREREFYMRNPVPGVSFIDIDAHPVSVAREIISCEFVFSSSLHGIVFSHSLGRPCLFVEPRVNEPVFKYKDYFSSLNIPFPVPVSGFESIRYLRKPISPVSIDISEGDFYFPGLEVLEGKGIVCT